MSAVIHHDDCLSAALGKRDQYTESHCERVEFLCVELGRWCNLSLNKLKFLKVASKLHDVGKIGIPDRILLKPGRLDPDELAIMRTHAEIGQNICDKIPHPDALKIGYYIRCHHEAFNGSGYPDGLAGEEIPLISRIISLADSYDAMLTTRPYHQARTHEQVMDIMSEECGIKTDPILFGHFQQIVSKNSLNELTQIYAQ